MKRKLAFFLAALMAFALLAACDSGGSGGGSATQKKDTLTLATPIDVGSFAPNERVSSGDSLIQSVIFMNLFRVSYPSREIKSEACVSWEGSADAKTYTFVIKDGIKFHNGEVMTVSDVVYSLEQCRTSPSQMTWSVNMDQVTALDDKTVQVTLLEPSTEFLAVAEIPLLHEATTVAAGESFREKPIGCGPYMLVSHEPDYQVTFKAFDDYIMGKPAFDNLIYRIIADPSSTILALEAGDIDGAQSTSFSELENIKSNDKLATFTNTLGLEALVMNHNIAPFDDVNVRMAFNYAIDKQKCSDTFYEGLAPIPTSHISVVEDSRLTGYPYNVEKAKEYLAAAGYPEGAGFPEVVIECIDVHRDYAQVIQNNLQEIGVKATVQIGEANSLIGRLASGEIPLCLMGFGLGTQPSVYAAMMMTGADFNFNGYGNPAVDALLIQAASEIDAAKQHDLYVEACLLMEQDAAYGLVGYQQILYIYNSALDIPEWGVSYPDVGFIKMK